MKTSGSFLGGNERSQARDVGEVLARVLGFSVDLDAEALLDRQPQLERVHRVQAEPFAKRRLIENHFRKSVAEPGKLFVNYVSTAAYMPPRWNADRLNPQIHSFVTGGEMTGRTGLGVVPMDFPNTRSGFIESLIARN